MINYTAVIRTLGTAGDKYQRLLNSLINQTIPPKDILVYIAKEYPIPKETVGIERYIYVDKGMAAQRALTYNEVTTEYILCLDDDLEFPSNTVEMMVNLLRCNNADVISPDIFPNNLRSFMSEIPMILSGRMRPRYKDTTWGYKVMNNSGYSYNKYPSKDVYMSQTNAGACFLCRKDDFLRIHFEDELWLDKMSYPIGEDQAMYYKMYCSGMKILTWYSHEFTHLDAGNNNTADKERKRLYGDIFFKLVFWHRFIYLPRKSYLSNFIDIISITYYLLFTLFVSFVKFNFKILNSKITAIKDALLFMKSDEYQKLPKVINVNE